MTPAAPDTQGASLVRSAVVTILVGLSIVGGVYFAHRLESAVGNFADFYGNVWWAGRQILDGKAAVPDGLTAWPPTATVFVAPVALLPYWVGLAAWTAISAGTFVAGLAAVGCRDRRALLVAALSPPALACVVLGNLSLILAAGVAVAWAYRDRPYVSGLTAGAVVAAKVWLWPILVFFLLTRRWVSFGAAVGWCVSGVAVWSALSPASLRAFPGWSDGIVENVAHAGVGLTSALVNAGLSVTAASAVALGAGLAILTVALRTRDELAILALCLVAALVASPLVWEHYYVVLFVPIAALAPRLSPLWFAPYVLGLKFLWPTTPLQIAACGVAALAGAALVAVGPVWRLRSPGGARGILTG